MKLNPEKLAAAVGLTWGLYVLLIGWVAAIGWGNTDLVSSLSGLYIGFKATFVGGIIGGLWGLIDGLIGGYLIALFYNWMIKSKK
jgi:hypothetical protein